MFAILLLILSINTCLSAYELSIIAMFRDESRYLKEWVDYHRLVGVEHFWLYNDHSQDNWEGVLQEYVDAGIVDVINWGDKDQEATYGYTRQPAIYRDGIQRSIGNTKWVALIDLDEFIVPMKDETIVDSLKNYPPEAEAIYINWRNFGTGGVTVPEGESILYHLTACSLTSHSNNSVGKCIVRPERVNLDTLWTPHHFDLLGGISYYDGSAKCLSMREDGTDFDYGQKHSAKFLRINHYVLRDEYFFWNFRYPRTGDKVLLEEHYKSFSLVKDTAIQRFVKKLSGM